MRKFLILASIIILVSCASKVPLPENVVTIQSGSAYYLDRIDFSNDNNYSSAEFATLKLCVAEIIANEDVILKDAAGSWVGPYTGNYYRNDNKQVVSGRGIFKYVDDKSTTLIANGTTSYSSGGLIPIKKFVKFNLKASSKATGYSIVFSNITRAQQSTGTLSNDGFNKVGVWSGADADGVYSQLQNVAKNIHACLGG